MDSVSPLSSLRRESPAMSAAPEPLLVIDDVVKRFETPDGAVTAVDHVSFTVAPGEFLSIIGPSGCGKSTSSTSIGGLLGDSRAASRSPARRVAGRTRRSAWCSRRNRPSPGAR